MSEHEQSTWPSVFDIAFLTNTADVTQLVLVRHGEQLADRLRGPVGDMIDPPLSERGRVQVDLVGERFANEPIDAIYSSPLERAYDTATAIARHHATAPVVIDDLSEIRLYDDIAPQRTLLEELGPILLRGVRARMVREKSWDVYPHSERSLAFRGRVVMAIDGIAAFHPGQRVVVACHGGVINAYLAHHLGIAYDMFFRPAHTAVNEVWAKGDVRSLRSLNDVQHLGSGPDLLSH